jgi:hypothetical protein
MDLVRLHAFNLTQYDAVVYYDLDVVIARCAFFDRHLHSRMSIGFHALLRLKRAGVWPMAFLSGVHFSYQFTL